MKKLLSIIISMSILLVACAALNNNPIEQDVVDPSESNYHAFFANRGIERNRLSRRQTEQRQATWTKSDQFSDVFVNLIVYEDGNGVSYLFSEETGQLLSVDAISFASANADLDVIENSVMREEEAIDIAERYLNMLVSNPNEYRLDEVRGGTPRNPFEVWFRHYIYDVPTDDLFRICIRVDGEIIWIDLITYGMFSNITVDPDALERAIAQSHDEYYQQYLTTDGTTVAFVTNYVVKGEPCEDGLYVTWLEQEVVVLE
ncbi:MAG: hypothetical protein FWE06_06775 [Oscillospiraceae bacterium]|nr:hypothetical protein [Oscillospiraceae bacterium]